MPKPWHEQQPAALAQLKTELDTKFPDLHADVEDNAVFLNGTFPILHEGVELDRFQIRVKIPPEFPRAIPMVWETGGRIPHSPDWHTYDGNTLCVIVPEEWLLNSNSASVVAFLEGPLRNFFLSHALAECGSLRPMGERPHGSRGLLEAYGDLIGSSELKTVKRFLEYLSKKYVKGHWDCPCGSGDRLRHCHKSEIEKLRQKIPRWVAKMALHRLEEQIQKERGAQIKSAI